MAALAIFLALAQVGEGFAADQAATGPTRGVVDAAIVPVETANFSLDGSRVPLTQRSRFDWDDHGVGVQLGFGLFGSVGGDIKEVGRDIGMRNPPGPVLKGVDVTGWFAISPSLRVGGWGVRFQGSTDEESTVTAALAGQQIQELNSSIRGGGGQVSYVYPWSRFAVIGSAGLGLGDVSFSLTRAVLGSPGTYAEYTNELATTGFSDTWRRDFSGKGPIWRLKTGFEVQVADWLSAGVDGGWTMLFVPSGNWIDEATGGTLLDTGGRNFRGWNAGLWLSAGLFPKREPVR